MLYYPISEFYKSRFGSKVYKIPVSQAETCPNREGLRGMKTCNFCDVWGSAAYPEIRDRRLKEQIAVTRASLKYHVHAKKFLVYFQAYTNTFQKVARLREQFEVAQSFDDVVGVVVATRPDCLSESVLDLWREYSEKFYVGVELGVQTFDESQLIWMRRGHTAQKSVEACLRIHESCPDINLGIHLMFGLPNETTDDIVKAARMANALPIQNVKLHNLHVLHDTPLADEYKRGLFTPINLATYADRVKFFLQNLRPDIAVHRLSALSRRSDELVAPDWTSKKMEIYQNIVDLLKRQKAYQGQFFRRTSLPFNSASAGKEISEPCG